MAGNSDFASDPYRSKLAMAFQDLRRKQQIVLDQTDSLDKSYEQMANSLNSSISGIRIMTLVASAAYGSRYLTMKPRRTPRFFMCTMGGMYFGLVLSGVFTASRVD
jgi:hypothetical protein